MKTTTKDFEKFKGYCREWIDIFGLRDYCFSYHHKLSSESKHSSQVHAGSMTRTAKVSLMMDWGKDYKVNDEELNRCALHEILHVVLNQLYELSITRHVMKPEIDTSEEAAVTRLENAIFKMTEKMQ